MFEIEKKAHVLDEKKVLAELYNFADFVHFVQKNDVYYSREISENRHISCRIRTEIEKTEFGEKRTNFFTYKKKENRISENGAKIEVNDEKETEILSEEPLKIFLEDSGFKINLQKQKKVHTFTTQTELGKCNLELCDVFPLGYFLEIEILCKDDSESTVKKANEIIKSFFEKCKISENQIEERYYSEMLKSVKIS